MTGAGGLRVHGSRFTAGLKPDTPLTCHPWLGRLLGRNGQRPTLKESSPRPLPLHFTPGQSFQDNPIIFSSDTVSQTTQAALSSLELAILGQLLAAGGTCDTLTALPIEKRSSMRQRIKACQQLQAKGYLSYNEDIVQFGLTLTGKTLLKLDLSVWPVTPDELMILRSGQGGRIGPSQIHRRVSVGDRQRLLERLAEQRLIVVYGRAIVNLNLTPVGSRYLIK